MMNLKKRELEDLHRKACASAWLRRKQLILGTKDRHSNRNNEHGGLIDQ